MLNLEIKQSEVRLRAVKSGIPLEEVVPKQDERYYTPNLESYFKGIHQAERG